MRRTTLRRTACAGIALAAAIATTGCIPMPGTTIVTCISCDDAKISFGGDPTAPETPDADPGEMLAGALPSLPVPDIGTPRGPVPAPDITDAAHVPPAGAEPPEQAEPALMLRLREAEGFCDMPCGVDGVSHIGYGHRLPLDTASGDALLVHDTGVAAAGARRVVGEPLWSALSEHRRDVLTEIAFMAGATGLAGFEEMLKALRAGDYARAAEEIVDSTLEPERRAMELAQLMREG